VCRSPRRVAAVRVSRTLWVCRRCAACFALWAKNEGSFVSGGLRRRGYMPSPLRGSESLGCHDQKKTPLLAPPREGEGNNLSVT
jgi:hypothetical protein